MIIINNMAGVTKTNLIIGEGEIGSALKSVLRCDSHDLSPLPPKHYDIIHITIPYGHEFNNVVREYQERYTPTHTVIHSTVPVGTCEGLGAVHSPVTGVHPHLEKSLFAFTKFCGGDGAPEVAAELRTYGIPAQAVPNSRDTEAGKLYALLIYGVNILIEKEIYEYCLANSLDYDVVYSRFVKMYNDGYQRMGMPHIKMYELTHMDGGIGGHCITQNAPMLGTQFANIIKHAGRNST